MDQGFTQTLGQKCGKIMISSIVGFEQAASMDLIKNQVLCRSIRRSFKLMQKWQRFSFKRCKYSLEYANIFQKNDRLSEFCRNHECHASYEQCKTYVWRGEPTSRPIDEKKEDKRTKACHCSFQFSRSQFMLPPLRHISHFI